MLKGPVLQVGMVIGSGGRTIRGLRESAGVENIQASFCLCSAFWLALPQPLSTRTMHLVFITL